MIVVDVETTGLDWHRSSIVSIGAVDFTSPTRQFYRACRPWEGAQLEQEALEVNGFSVQQLSDPALPSLEKVMGEFVAWADDASDRILGGHNTFFDRDFLQDACERFHLTWAFGRRIVDLHSICWAHMVRTHASIPTKRGRSNITTDIVHTYVGLPEEPRPHHGLTGAQMEAEAFSRLIRGKNLLSQFARYPVPEALTDTHDQTALF